MTPESHLIIQAPGIRLDGTATEGSPYFGTEGIIRELCGDITTEEAFGQHNTEAAILAGALFEGAPVRKSCEAVKALGEKRRDVTVAGAVNTAEEAWFIARDIKESCLAGKGPALERILVYPSSATYIPLIKEAFTDYGIPYHISQGTPLTQSPVVASFLNLLSLPAEKYSFSAMRRVFASPFIRLWPDGNRLEAFDAFARKGGITGGRQRWVKAADGAGRIDGDASFVPPLRQLLSFAGRINGNKSVGAWADDCLHLLDDAGFPAAVEQYSNDRPEIAAAFEALLKELQRIKEYQFLMPGGIEAGRFVRVLKRQLLEKSFSVKGGTVSGVRILGRQEVFSEPFDAVYACGLSDGTLPAPVRRDIFLPDGLAKALGLPASRESLTRDARLFLALLLSANKVVLTWPESAAKGPSSPSPYIRALEPLIRAGYAAEMKRVCRPVGPEAALGPDELIRTLSC
jgi:ATP-dependent helicase/DNAse subunit B